MRKIINGIIWAARGFIDFFAFSLFLMLFADFLGTMGEQS